MWLKSVYFSFCNCSSTKHVICLIREHLVRLLISMSRAGRGHGVNTGPRQVSQPGEPEEAQMKETGRVEVNASECPNSLLVDTRESCWDKTSGCRKWEQEAQGGPRSHPGLVFVIRLMNNRRQSERSPREQKEPSQYWPTGRDGAPSVRRTVIVRTCYPVLLFQENESVYTCPYASCALSFPCFAIHRS